MSRFPRSTSPTHLERFNYVNTQCFHAVVSTTVLIKRRSSSNFGTQTDRHYCRRRYSMWKLGRYVWGCTRVRFPVCVTAAASQKTHNSICVYTSTMGLSGSGRSVFLRPEPMWLVTGWGEGSRAGTAVVVVEAAAAMPCVDRLRTTACTRRRTVARPPKKKVITPTKKIQIWSTSRRLDRVCGDASRLRPSKTRVGDEIKTRTRTNGGNSHEINILNTRARAYLRIRNQPRKRGV